MEGADHLILYRLCSFRHNCVLHGAPGALAQQTNASSSYYLLRIAAEGTQGEAGHDKLIPGEQETLHLALNATVCRFAHDALYGGNVSKRVMLDL